jgi:serine/threonine protein kinase
MEFMPHGSLCEVLQKEKLELLDMVTMCRHVAAGLAQLAANSVVHLDIAARNILVCNNPGGDKCRFQAKISDFGLAELWEPYLKLGSKAVPSTFCSCDLISSSLERSGSFGR